MPNYALALAPFVTSEPPSHRAGSGKCAETCAPDTSYAATNACGNDMTPLHSPGIPGCLACHKRAGKYPVLEIFELRLVLPTQKHLGQCRIKRDACVGVFGFDVAYYPGDDASPHEEREVIPEHVTPLESEELAATEPCGEIEDNHHAEWLIELSEQAMTLSSAQNHWLPLPFACASDSHELHWILADLGKFPTHRAIQQHSHEIVEMPSGPRSQV